jgi:AraC family transcriptional regulator
MSERSNTRRQFLRYAGAAGIYVGLDASLGAGEAGAATPAVVGTAGRARTGRMAAEYVVCLRHIGPYDQVNETWGQLSSYALEKSLTGRATKAIGIIYDDPTVTPADRIRYDACLSVDRDTFLALRGQADGVPGIRFEVIEDRETVSMVHRGPHKSLGGTYEALLDSAASAAGRPTDRVAPPYYEIYLNNPRFVRAEELLTEVHVPLTTGAEALA